MKRRMNKFYICSICGYKSLDIKQYFKTRNKNKDKIICLNCKNSRTKDNSICIIEVNENIRRVKVGMELTKPLKVLQENCDFKRKYDKWCEREAKANEPKKEYEKKCIICNKIFITNYINKKTCSENCRRLRDNERHRIKRKLKNGEIL